MYRLVASDMDETFLDANHGIPEANIEALRRMRELGVLFVPSSGRPYPSIMANFAKVDQSLLEGTYVISYNGGCINRYGEDRPLLSTSMDRALAEELYRDGRERGLCVHIYTVDGTIFIQDASEREREIVHDVIGVRFIPGDVDMMELVREHEIVKLIYNDFDFTGLQRLGEGLRDELSAKGVDVSYSSKRYLELMPVGVNKGTGLAHLADMLDIRMDETVGVGDSSNDLAMIEAAGLGVGVANVTDDTRDACDLVLDTAGPDGAFLELVERALEPSR